MREIRQSGFVRWVRSNPYPYRDFCGSRGVALSKMRNHFSE